MVSYSFIIPHYNCPEQLSRLLKTIPARMDIEIIVIDDNSDPSKLPQIDHPRATCICLSANESKGAGHARNVGLSKAKGRWLLFADSDDFYTDGFIQELDKFVNCKSDVVFFSAWLNYKVNEPYDANEVNALEEEIENYKKSKKKDNDIHRLLMSTNVPWNKMFNANFIRKIQVKFEEIPIANDAWFSVYSGYKADSVEIIDKRLYYYVLNENSISHKVRPLEHYKMAMKSSTKRNMLFFKRGFYDLISIPGFNENNLIRDFGKKAYYKLLFSKMLQDPTFLVGVISILKNKTKQRE